MPLLTFLFRSLLPARGYQPRGRDEGLTLGQGLRGLLGSASRKIAVEVWQEGGSDKPALNPRDYGVDQLTKLQIVSGHWLPGLSPPLFVLPPEPPSRHLTSCLPSWR